MQITRIRSKPFTTDSGKTSDTTTLKLARVFDENTYYRFDNKSSYLQHSELTLNTGGVVTYNFTTDVQNPVLSNSRIFDNLLEDTYVECSLSGTIAVVGDIDAYLDGKLVVSGITPNPQQGVQHKLDIIAKSTISINYISSPNKPFHGFIYDVSCDDITNTDVYTTGTAFWSLQDSWYDSKTSMSESNNTSTDDISSITTSGAWAWNEASSAYKKASYYGQLYVTSACTSTDVRLTFSTTDEVDVRLGGVIFYEDVIGDVDVVLNNALGLSIELSTGTSSTVTALTDISLTATTYANMLNFSSDNVYSYLSGINFKTEIVSLLESLHINVYDIYYSDIGKVQYKETSSDVWIDGFNLTWDEVGGCLGGIIVYLEEDTSYDVKITLVRGNLIRSSIHTVTTITTPTIGNTYNLSDIYTSGILDIPALISAETIVAGTEEAYTKIVDDGSTPITTRLTDQAGALYIGSASYLYFEGITVEGGIPNGIKGEDAHHIWIDGCDISGFGRDVDHVTNGLSYDSDGDLINYDSGITFEDGYMIVVQNSSVHSPVPSANSWTYGHPSGPNAFLANYGGASSDNRGRIILRNNTFYGTDTHRFNDVVESRVNGAVSGGFVKNSAIYGNTFSYSNDDVVELDGGMFNVAFYDNDCSHAYSGISAIPCMRGPCFIFNNYIHDMGDEDGNSYFGWKVGGIPYGKVYILNNLAKLTSNGVSDTNYDGVYLPFLEVTGNIIIQEDSGYFGIKDEYHYVENKFKDNYLYTIADNTSNFNARITSHFNDPSVVNTEYAQSIWDDSNTWFSIKMVEGIVPNISRLDGNNTLIGKL